MKIKSKTKKAIVLSVMVVLLVATGVLNWALNDKLTKTDEPAAAAGTVTETFFASYRNDREATRESEFLYLDTIIKSEETSASSKAAAEAKKLELVTKMELELELETLIKARGYADAVVSIGNNGVNVVVGVAEMSDAEANQIYSDIAGKTDYKAKQVKIIKYD